MTEKLIKIEKSTFSRVLILRAVFSFGWIEIVILPFEWIGVDWGEPRCDEGDREPVPELIDPATEPAYSLC